MHGVGVFKTAQGSFNDECICTCRTYEDAETIAKAMGAYDSNAEYFARGL